MTRVSVKAFIFALMLGMTAPVHMSFAQNSSNAAGDDFLMTPDVLKRKAAPTDSKEKSSETAVEPIQPEKSKSTETPPEVGTPETKVEVSTPPSDTPDSTSKTNETLDKSESSNEKKEVEAGTATSETGTTEKKAEIGATADPGQPASKNSQEAKQEITIKTRKDILSPANWRGTLMLDPNDLKVLMAARQIYLRNKEAGGDGSGEGYDKEGLKLSDEEIAASKKGPGDIRTPVITLDSIVYFNSTNWSVWINGKKYSPESKTDNFTISEVSSRKVTFTWNAALIEMFFPEWKNVSIQQGELWTIKRGNNEIYINERTREIYFSLYPNQTFIGKELDILEGKVQNQSGFDVLPIATSSNLNPIEKALEALVPDNKQN